MNGGRTTGYRIWQSGDVRSLAVSGAAACWATDAGKVRFSPADACRAAALSGESLARFRRGRAALAALLPEGAVVSGALCPDCGRPHGGPVVNVDGTASPGAAAIHASISHAGDGSIAAVSPARVGVDVERRDAPLRAPLPVAVPPREDPLQHWTRIEAVLKADGRGLRVDPREAVLSRAGEGWLARLDGRVYRVHDIPLTPDHAIAIALEQTSRSEPPPRR